MFNKDNKFKLNTSKPEKKAKKEKAEKAPKEKKEGGKLFGGRSFGKESGGKLSDTPKKEKKSLSFSFKRKEKEGKVSNDFSKGGGKLSEGGSKRSFKERFAWVKWWHIVIAAVVLVAIIVGIVLAVTLGGNNTPGGVEDFPPEPIPEPEGTVTIVGTFTPEASQEYILCEYKEYFSGKTVIIIQKESDILHDYKAYWMFISEDGKPSAQHNILPDNLTPEQIKTAVLNMMSKAAGYTPEIIAKCDVHIYQPVSFTKVKLSSATLTSDNKVTMKYQAGAVDGELSAEYTLNGTYTSADNNYTFTYSNLPEDANLRRVAEKALTSAKYESFIMYGSWTNTLTFGDNLTLSLITAE